MSVVRNRKLKKMGITGKRAKRKARKYIMTFVKCNRGYACNNIAFNMGVFPEFWMHGSLIQ